MTMAQPVEPTTQLVDIPCVYLLDRSQWHEYRKSLNDCALTWNIPDWMTTIVYKGREWQEIKKKGTDLEKFFPPPKMTIAVGEEQKDEQMPDLVQLLGLPKNTKDMSSSTQFCNLAKVEYETGPTKALALDGEEPEGISLCSWCFPLPGG
jgi:hypothetical protein